MEKKLTHIDHLFREGLGDFTETPPPSVWEALEERLDNKEKRRAGFYYRRYWFIILLAFIGLGGSTLYAWRMMGDSPDLSAAGTPSATTIAAIQKTAPDTDGATTTTALPIKATTSEIIKSRKHRSAHIAANHIIAPAAPTTSTLQVAAVGEQHTKTTNKSAAQQIEMEHALAMNNATSADNTAENLPTTKATVIRYIVKNTTHHNIQMAESEPVFVNEVITHSDNTISNPVEEEDEVVFGNNITHPKPAAAIAPQTAIAAIHSSTKLSPVQGAVVQKASVIAHVAVPTKNVTEKPVEISHSTKHVTSAIQVTQQPMAISAATVPSAAQPTLTADYAATKTVSTKKKNTPIPSTATQEQPIANPSIEQKQSTKIATKEPYNAPPPVAQKQPNPTHHYSVIKNTTAIQKSVATTSSATIDINTTSAHIAKKKKHTAPVEPITAQATIVSATKKQSTAKLKKDAVAVAATIAAKKEKQIAQPLALNSKKSKKQPIIQPADNGSHTEQAPVAPTAVADIKPLVAQAKVEAPKIIGTFKKDSIVPIPHIVDNTPAATSTDAVATKIKHNFLGCEVGVKAGYEGSFGAGAAQKFVVSPFLERKLSGKVSVMVQPGIKYAGMNSKSLNGSQSYYDVDKNSTTIHTNKYLIVVHNGDTIWRIDETVTESHDSVVKTYTAGGSYLELELPILLKYSLSKKLSVYGGANLSYSKFVAIHENTWRSAPITQTGTGFYLTPDPAPSVSSIMQYSGTPLSGYNGPLYPTPKGNAVRLGYMLGFSYQFNKRWLADCLIQQGNAKANVQGGYNTNTALSSTYFRFTLGYKLFQ